MNHRHRQPRLQVGCIRSAREDHVRAPRPRRLDFAHGIVVSARDHAQIGALVIFARDLEQQVAQAADAERPDSRPRRNIGEMMGEKTAHSGKLRRCIEQCRRRKAQAVLCSPCFLYEIINFTSENTGAREPRGVPAKSSS
jgi:hypothetical protein